MNKTRWGRPFVIDFALAVTHLWMEISITIVSDSNLVQSSSQMIDDYQLYGLTAAAPALWCQSPSRWHLYGKYNTGSRAGHLQGNTAGAGLVCGRLSVTSSFTQTDQGLSSTQRSVR